MQKHKCKGCPDRYPGCHDHCKTFQDIKAANDAEKAADKGRIDAFRYQVEMQSKNADRNIKKKARGRMTYTKRG